MEFGIPTVGDITADPTSPEIAEQAAYHGDGFFSNHIFRPASHTTSMVKFYRQRFEHYGHGRAEDAIVGLGGLAASEDWGTNGVAGDLRTRVDRAAKELADLVAARPALHRADPFGDVPDFASLLGS